MFHRLHRVDLGFRNVSGFRLQSGRWLTRTLQSLFCETSAHDPWVLGAVGAVLLVTSVLACARPAVWAAKVDVCRLLRSEWLPVSIPIRLFVAAGFEFVLPGRCSIV